MTGEPTGRLGRAKAAATVVAAVALFAAGWHQFGFPPVRVASHDAPSPSPASPGGAPPAGGRTIITINNGAPETDPKRRVEQQLVAAHYERKHPDATLRHDTWQFSPDSFFAKYIGGTLPDVIGLFATEANEILARGAAADITDEVRAWPLFDQVDPRMLDLITRDGRIYGMPVGGANTGFYVMTLFYSVPLLREAGLVGPDGKVIPPDNWDDFTTYAIRLTNRDKGVAGFGLLGETGACGWHFLNWVWQSGGDFERQDADGRWRAVFDQPEAVRALQFLKDLRWKHDVLQRNVLANNDEIMEQFAAGRIAMAMLVPEYLVYLVDKYGMNPDHIGICLLPKGPAGRANQIGGGFLIVNNRLTGLRKTRAVDALLIDHDLDLIEPRMKLLSEQGRRIGIPTIPIFKPGYQARINAIVDKYRNLPDLSALMEEARTALHPEPPYKSQQLYQLYTGPAVQEVLVDEDADPAALLGDAARRFQTRVLEPLNERLTKSAAGEPQKK